jgi:hypothetical protein
MRAVRNMGSGGGDQYGYGSAPATATPVKRRASIIGV